MYKNHNIVSKYKHKSCEQNEKEVGKVNFMLDDVYFKRKVLTTGKDEHVLIKTLIRKINYMCMCI